MLWKCACSLPVSYRTLTSGHGKTTAIYPLETLRRSGSLVERGGDSWAMLNFFSLMIQQLIITGIGEDFLSGVAAQKIACDPVSNAPGPVSKQYQVNPLVHQARLEWSLFFDMLLVPHLGHSFITIQIVTHYCFSLSCCKIANSTETMFILEQK